MELKVLLLKLIRLIFDTRINYGAFHIVILKK
jgi:hypothetical protein